MTGYPASRWFLYGVLYTLAILVFGVRMAMKYRHNRYHLVRTASVSFCQLVLAWLLPNLLVRWNEPYMEFNGVWPLKYDYLWPDKVGQFVGAGTVGRFLLIYALVAAAIATPVLTYFFGKRWYCSWVCGCGGLAETLGDPWRQLSDKSHDRVARSSAGSDPLGPRRRRPDHRSCVWGDSPLGLVRLGRSGVVKQWYGFYIGRRCSRASSAWASTR